MKLLLASLALLFSSPAVAGSPAPDRVLLESERNTIEVFSRVSGSVVFINTSELRRNRFTRNATEVARGAGSGFVWDKLGRIVTNAHVVQTGTNYSVTLTDGTVRSARLIGMDTTKDLAVLQIDPKGVDLHPVVPGTSHDLLVGQKVFAIGNPFGLDQTLTTGIISALGREITSVANTTIQDVIQTDAAINPGNSGGPLIDSQGRLIGVNTAIYSPSGASAGIGFAVPVDTVRRIVPQLIKYGRVKRAGLGITVISDDLARGWGIRGVIVRDVEEGGSAARAGLRRSTMDRRGRVTLGDVIVAVDGQEVRRFDDLFTALDGRKPGDTVRISLLRGNKRKWVELKLQELR